MRLKIQTESPFWLYLVLLLLTLPLPWVLAAFLAAAIHEMFHLFILKYCHIPVYELRIRAGGAVLDTGVMGEWEELACALAGPAGSFLLVSLLHIVPRIAVCGLVQGAFNLLPVGNLDGGRVVRCAIRLIRGKSPCKRCRMRVQ